MLSKLLAERATEKNWVIMVRSYSGGNISNSNGRGSRSGSSNFNQMVQQNSSNNYNRYRLKKKGFFFEKMRR